MKSDTTIARPPTTAGATTSLLTLEMLRAQYLPIGERTIFRLISAGKFPRADVRIGAKLRLWRRETIERWIENNAGASKL